MDNVKKTKCHYLINKKKYCPLYFLIGYRTQNILLTARIFKIYKDLVLKYIIKNFKNDYYKISKFKYIFNKFKLNFKNDIKEICTICFDKINDNGFFLNCKHQFHYNCIKKWFNSCQTCPLCKKKYGDKQLEFGIDYMIDID
mgnify:CR=1 FL=1